MWFNQPDLLNGYPDVPLEVNPVGKVHETQVGRNRFAAMCEGNGHQRRGIGVGPHCYLPNDRGFPPDWNRTRSSATLVEEAGEPVKTPQIKCSAVGGTGRGGPAGLPSRLARSRGLRERLELIWQAWIYGDETFSPCPRQRACASRFLPV